MFRVSGIRLWKPQTGDIDDVRHLLWWCGSLKTTRGNAGGPKPKPHSQPSSRGWLPMSMLPIHLYGGKRPQKPPVPLDKFKQLSAGHLLGRNLCWTILWSWSPLDHHCTQWNNTNHFKIRDAANTYCLLCLAVIHFLPGNTLGFLWAPPFPAVSKLTLPVTPGAGRWPGPANQSAVFSSGSQLRVLISLQPRDIQWDFCLHCREDTLSFLLGFHLVGCWLRIESSQFSSVQS